MKHLLTKEQVNFDQLLKEDHITRDELYYLRGGEGGGGGDTGDNDNGDPGNWNP